MVSIYSNADLVRKVQTVKNWMHDDQVYCDRLLTRLVVRSGASGLYNRSVRVKHTDTIVSGIAIYKPEFMNLQEEIMTTNIDVQFTCKECDAAKILAANELWLEYKLTGSAVTSGIMYRIQSDTPDLFSIDHVFNLVTAAKT